MNISLFRNFFFLFLLIYFYIFYHHNFFPFNLLPFIDTQINDLCQMFSLISLKVEASSYINISNFFLSVLLISEFQLCKYSVRNAFYANFCIEKNVKEVNERNFFICYYSFISNQRYDRMYKYIYNFLYAL